LEGEKTGGEKVKEIPDEDRGIVEKGFRVRRVTSKKPVGWRGAVGSEVLLEVG